jgi:cellobiose phosphorylase
VFDLINPVLHSHTSAGMQRYQVEPYVIAADVYSVPPHTGRGGWTWYTGSASWTYRVALESILGFDLHGRQLRFQPCVPRDWKEFQLAFQVGTTRWEFTVETNLEEDEAGADSASNGSLPRSVISLIDDGREHRLTIRSGAHAAEPTPSTRLPPHFLSSPARTEAPAHS